MENHSWLGQELVKVKEIQHKNVRQRDGGIQMAKRIKPKLRETLRSLVNEQLEMGKTLDTADLARVAEATTALISRARIDLAIELLVVVQAIEQGKLPEVVKALGRE